MQYAVLRSGGKQYKVQIGDVLILDKIEAEKADITFDNVLLLVDEDKIIIGNPTVKGAKIEAKLLEQKRGKKIEVRKFKAKSRYRKKIGFRAEESVVKIEKIDYKTLFSNKNPTKTTKTASKKAK